MTIFLTLKTIDKFSDHFQEIYLKYILYSGFFKRFRAFLNLASESIDPKNVSENELGQIEALIMLLDQIIFFW